MKPPKRYDPKVKQAILEAVQAARKGGGKFADAFEAAKKAGYNGSSGGLYQMIYNSKGGSKKRGRKKSATKAVAATPVAAKPVAAKSGTDSIVADIAALVDKAVHDRLATAISALEGMM